MKDILKCSKFEISSTKNKPLNFRIIMKKTNIIRFTGIALILLFMSGSVMSQVTNFSGNWKLNPAKSKLNEQFSMAPKDIVITQDATILAIVRHSSFQDQDFTINDKFTLDGKESVNQGFMDTKKTSTVAISEDKTSVTIKSKIPMENGGEFSITEILKIADGCLSLETTASGDWGTSTETYVFDKQ